MADLIYLSVALIIGVLIGMVLLIGITAVAVAGDTSNLAEPLPRSNLMWPKGHPGPKPAPNVRPVALRPPQKLQLTYCPHCRGNGGDTVTNTPCPLCGAPPGIGALPPMEPSSLIILTTAKGTGA